MAVPEQDPAKSGCLSGFLRLLLCAHSDHAPPIHPSDHFPEHPPSYSQTHPFHPNKPMPNTNAVATPGVVARLMGLDSLPNTSRVSKRIAPDSVPRSKSVNFLDYLLQFDRNHYEASHRRMRTSSFREVPASSSFQQRKSHDLVVFLWDDNCGTKSQSNEVVRLRPSTRKSEVSLVESRQRKEKKEEEEKMKKISKLKNETRRECVSTRTRTENYNKEYGKNGGSKSNSWSSRTRMGKEEAFVEPKFRKRVRKQKSLKKMQNERCSEDRSPVSVLDAGGDDDSTFPTETRFGDTRRPLSSKSKRKSSGELYLDEDVEERGRSSNKGNAYPEANTETEYCSELMARLLKLTENDIRQSDCTQNSMFDFESETFQEISLMFEHKIFDLLLREVVDELVEF